MDESTKYGSTVGLITNVRPGSVDENTELGWVAVGSLLAFSAPDDHFSIVGKAAADLSSELTQESHKRVCPVVEHQNDGEAVFLKISTADPEGISEWKPNS